MYKLIMGIKNSEKTHFAEDSTFVFYFYCLEFRDYALMISTIWNILLFFPTPVPFSSAQCAQCLFSIYQGWISMCLLNQACSFCI